MLALVAPYQMIIYYRYLQGGRGRRRRCGLYASYIFICNFFDGGRRRVCGFHASLIQYGIFINSSEEKIKLLKLF